MQDRAGFIAGDVFPGEMLSFDQIDSALKDFESEVSGEEVRSAGFGNSFDSGANANWTQKLGGKINQEPRYAPELMEGDRVRHQLFGEGVVVELDGDNAAIYFKNKGTKTLNITFAPLEKL
jgi:hypothetical protein